MGRRTHLVVVILVLCALLAGSSDLQAGKPKRPAVSPELARPQGRLDARGRPLSAPNTSVPIGHSQGAVRPTVPLPLYAYSGPPIMRGFTVVHNFGEMGLHFGIRNCTNGLWYDMYLSSGWYNSYPDVCGLSVYTDFPDGRRQIASYPAGPGVYLLGFNFDLGIWDFFLP